MRAYSFDRAVYDRATGGALRSFDRRTYDRYAKKRRTSGTSTDVGVGVGPDGATVVVTPLTIISSVTVLQWVRGDLGITISTGVSAWADQSGHANHFAQATGAAQPTYSASDASLNNQATLAAASASSQQLVNTTLSMGAGLWMSGIIRETTRGNAAVWGSPSGQTETCDLFDQSGTGNVGTYSGIISNQVSLPVNTWLRAECFYSITAAYNKLGSTLNSTNTSVGTNSCTGTSIFSTTGLAFWTGKIAERVVCSGKPTSGEISALDAYYTARYGSGLV